MNFKPLFIMNDLVAYGARSGSYVFVINHDTALNVYGASWTHVSNPHDSNFIGNNIHPNVGLPYFDTMEAAVEACVQQLEKFNAENTSKPA